jgi:hypothetical protein
VLFASHPILSLAESFTAAARHHFHAVRCELVRTGAEELVETCLAPDLPPSPRGFLRVRFAGEVARAAALLSPESSTSTGSCHGCLMMSIPLMSRILCAVRSRSALINRRPSSSFPSEIARVGRRRA